MSIRPTDLGTFLAATDSAARTRLPADASQQRMQATEVAAYLDRKHETARIGVEETDDAWKVKERDDDEDPGTYDEHGRREPDADGDEPHGDDGEEPHRHLDLTA